MRCFHILPCSWELVENSLVIVNFGLHESKGRLGVVDSDGSNFLVITVLLGFAAGSGKTRVTPVRPGKSATLNSPLDWVPKEDLFYSA